MTLWLGRLTLNLYSPEAQRDLSDVHHMHQRVMSFFPDDAEDEQARSRHGVLFRVERHEHAPVLLMQSHTAPDPQRLPEKYALREFTYRTLQPLVEALHEGMAVRYRILGNPVKQLPRGYQGENGKPGQRVRLTGEAAEEWWQRRAESAGLRLGSSVLAIPQPDLVAYKAHGKHDMRHPATRFEGPATVNDIDAVHKALYGGIGRAKSYGCGLLSLAPL